MKCVESIMALNPPVRAFNKNTVSSAAVSCVTETQCDCTAGAKGISVKIHPIHPQRM